MLWNALTAACNAIAILARISQWKCKPVLILTFDDISDYARADADLTRALAEQQLTPRQTMEHSSSLEIYGVKVRLDCSQRYQLPSGEIISGVDALRQGKIKTIDNQ